ncbi:MAG: prolyl oligopeptidase family serine peptidase [Planctomycetia bacterium]|nr:prolyl oligopeptidase family serine peptidase [Planctomycetia bacterium]
MMPLRKLLCAVSIAWGSLLGSDIATAAETEAWPPWIVRRLPPVVAPLGAADLAKAKAALAEINEALGPVVKPWSEKDALRPDVEIFRKAIDLALRHNEFFKPDADLKRVEALKKIALERAAALASGKAPWAETRGVVVRGFRSLIDDSVQPYALVIPEKLDLTKPVPLYVWLHGRGDTQCDLQFIAGFLGTKAPGPLQPENAIVLHPFGRYCNGFKSAGEIDVLEAIADVSKNYKIDDDRIVMAGFSMGGAGAWHMGAHFADRWCAVHPGAGFVDVRRYQNITPDKMPPSYEQTLWGLYDVPDYRRNLLNVPVIAYSGADDKQKAAADIMEQALAEEGLKIPHLIGPGVGHKYHPETLAEIQRRLADIVSKGRDKNPSRTSLQTKTLRYDKMGIVLATGLEKHWDDSRIDLVRNGEKIVVRTKNISSFAINEPIAAEIEVDGQTIDSPFLFVKENGVWKNSLWKDFVKAIAGRKSPVLQGPIDDAFRSRFTVVPPDAKTNGAGIDRWAEFESQHFLSRWCELMRGEPLRKSASKVNDEDIATSNLVLWGTPHTNPLIAKILDKLPIRWTDKVVGIGDLEFDATKVVPVLIYPNPLNREKYVALNSGLTFREAVDRTNSLQNPKLPDWAFIDTTQPPTDELPGKVVAAGFFDEEWKYVPKDTAK